MKVDRRTRGFLEDMVEHARFASEFVAGIDRTAFDDNREKQFAVVRALEVIGEAAKSVPRPVRDMAPDVPWKQIAAMRDKLIHHYFGANIEIVWGSATIDAPLLVEKLSDLLSGLAVEDATGADDPE